MNTAPTKNPDFKNPLEVMQPGEQVLCNVKRHPIGLIGTYVTGGLIIVAALVGLIVASQYIVGDNRSQILAYGAAGFVVVTAFTMLIMLIAAKVYWGNRWIVTSDSITEVTQTSLFDRRSSQLSLANLEDVSASQDGILAHMFNYGTIHAETAGERSRFIFRYCPNPNYYAQQILQGREAFEQDRGRWQSRPPGSSEPYGPPSGAQPGNPGAGGPPAPGQQNY